MIHLPFTPTKGSAFRLYFGQPDNITSATGIDAVDYIGISKDSGTFTETTNSATQITVDSSESARTRGRYFVDLTASEMDADVIIFIALGYSGSFDFNETIIIYTTGATGLDTPGGADAGVANFTSNFLNLLIVGIQQGHDLVDVAIAQSNYNYYGLRRSNSDWLIVKESIADGSLTYAYRTNNNGRSYTSAWSNYEGLIYSGSQTVISQ